MILRLLRGRAPAERADEVAEVLGGAYVRAARRFPGLTSYAAGVRVEGALVHFVLATTWDSVDDVARQTAGRLDRPVVALPASAQTDAIDHFELVGEAVPLIIGPSEGVVRVARMVVRPGREEEFYATVRRGLEDPTHRGELLAYHLGRRVGQTHDVAAVSVWRSGDALGRLVARETGAPLWASELEALLERFEVEHFDAVGPSGPG